MTYRYQDLEISPTQVRHGRKTYPAADVHFDVHTTRDHTTFGNVMSTVGSIVFALGVAAAVFMYGGAQVDMRWGFDAAPATQLATLGVGVAVGGLLLSWMAPKRDYFSLQMKVQRRAEPVKIKTFTQEGEARQALQRLQGALQGH